MDDLEQAMAEVDDRVNERKRTEAVFKAALKAEHESIRHALKVGSYGTLAALAERTGYSRAHLDRIRRGKTSG